MHTVSHEDLTDRVTQLERQNRRLSRLCLSLTAYLVCLVLMGAVWPHARIIEAEQFIIKDRDGRVRGSFGIASPSGSPGLVLYDPEANANVLLNLGPSSEPGLWLYNQDRVRAGLMVRADRMVLEMYDKEDHPRLVLGVYHDGSPGLELYDQRERLRAAFGRTGLDLTRAVMGEADLPTWLTVLDAEGQIVWQAP